MLTLRGIFIRAVSTRDRIQEPLEYRVGGRQREWAGNTGLEKTPLELDGIMAEKIAGLENALVINQAVSRP